MFGTKDTQADIDERIRTRQIAEQVWKEATEKWPSLGPHNVQECLSWMDTRVNELKQAPHSAQ